MTSPRNSLIDSAILLALIPALLYAISTAYYDGYYVPLHLDADILDRNVQQSLYRGFIISFMPAFYALFTYISLAFVFTHYLFPGFNDWLRHSQKRKRQFLKLKQVCLSKRKDSEIERRLKKHSHIVIFYFAILVVLLSALVYFESKGKKEAIAIFKKIENNAIQPSDLITVKIDDKPKQLLSLMCGARNCAGIDPNTKVIYYFPQNGHSYQFIETSTNQIVSSAGKAP
jgi:amino acid transporter